MLLMKKNHTEETETTPAGETLSGLTSSSDKSANAEKTTTITQNPVALWLEAQYKKTKDSFLTSNR